MAVCCSLVNLRISVNSFHSSVVPTLSVCDAVCHLVLMGLCLVVKIKKNADNSHKFKLRLSKYLYTLTITDPAKADKITLSIPPGTELLRNFGFHSFFFFLGLHKTEVGKKDQ